MDDRLVALEEKFAFIEHQVEQLDGVIRDAFDRIDGLSRDLQQVRAAIEQTQRMIGQGPPSDA